MEEDRGKILPFKPKKPSPEVSDKVVKVRSTDQLLDIMAKISPALRNPETRERVRKMIEDPNPKATP